MGGSGLPEPELTLHLSFGCLTPRRKAQNLTQQAHIFDVGFQN
jgi:hypothetical protein